MGLHKKPRVKERALPQLKMVEFQRFLSEFSLPPHAPAHTPDTHPLSLSSDHTQATRARPLNPA